MPDIVTCPIDKDRIVILDSKYKDSSVSFFIKDKKILECNLIKHKNKNLNLTSKKIIKENQIFSLGKCNKIFDKLSENIKIRPEIRLSKHSDERLTLSLLMDQNVLNCTKK